MCSYEIHALKVANLCISLKKAVQHVAQFRLQLGAGSWVFYVRVCAQHIKLNLLNVWVRVHDRLIVLQLLVVSGVGMHLT